MNVAMKLAALGVLVSTNAIAEGQHHEKKGFTFQASDIQAFGVPSILRYDTDQFVFNDALTKIDWHEFLAKQAELTVEEQEILLHFAGHFSINPAVLVALMEVVKEHALIYGVDNPTAFEGLTDKTEFAEQIEDVASFLTSRLYAFKDFAQLNPKSQIAKLYSPASVALNALFAKSKINGYSEFALAYGRFAELTAHAIVMDPNTRDVEQHNTQISQTAAFSMSLPWPYGYAWYSGGAHSNTGSGYPYSSLDFNNGSGGWGSNTPWLQAAHEGTVTRYSSCNMRITHPSGYATQYYHMDSLQYGSGAYVNQGAWIGRYANSYNQALCEGGQSSGPHVHFSLLQNGYFVSLHNRYISGYRVDVGNSNYDDNCNNFYFEKNGYRYCAWRPLYNN
ncbi:Protease lasA precursor [Pseudoalteromonas luteoviolacea B = ATCC 29581]|nr:Protease lasA precursor [Pseudoalteromonas luteoviolacea B = ATCC 29581]